MRLGGTMDKFWYRLDNAAMIFPPVSGKNTPNTFCLFAELNKKIDKEILQKSLNQVLESEDTFRVRLKKGIFWNYLEENFKTLEVQEEPPDFMEYIDSRYDDNYLMRVYYYENRITCVFFHVLTDGAGGLYFLNQLVYTYLENTGEKIKTEGKVKPIEIPTLEGEKQDKFLNVKTKDTEKKIAENKAFKLSGTPFKVFGTGIIVGRCKTEEVKKLAKQFDTTVTGYLSGVYLYSLYLAYLKDKNQKNNLIAISIPVNIRKQHPSETKRNFTLVARISYDFSNGATLEEVVESASKQLKEKLTKKQIDSQIKFNVGAEKNWIMKIVPRFIKNVALKIAYKIRCINQETTNLSNLGLVNLPQDIEKHVDSMGFILQASKTTQKNLGVVGFKDELVMSFSRRHAETFAEKEFFRILSHGGVEVTVSSNNWEVRK